MQTERQGASRRYVITYPRASALRLSRKQYIDTVLFAACIVGGAACACGQAPLEYSPYQIDLFIAPADPAALDDKSRHSVAQQVQNLAQAHVGAPWALEVHFASDELLGELLSGDALTSKRLIEVTPKDRQRHKGMYVVLTKDNAHWQVRARELDFRTFRLSPPGKPLTVPQSALADGILDALIHVFSPLIHLDSPEGDTVTGVVQAAGLAIDAESPVVVQRGEPLLGIIRHNDRLGRAKPENVLEIPWTILEALRQSGSELTCKIHSAHARPLGGKSRLRLVRYGQVVRAQPQPVQLVLQTPAGSPLAGYELLTRDAESGTPLVLGTTNERGAATLAAAQRRWQLVFVRHGDRVLARLPLVSGLQTAYTVELPSDDMRLAAEGFVSAFRQEIIDTVSRRQILVTRIRRRIADGQFEQAEQLLGELQQLDNAADFSRRLQQARSDYMADTGRAQQLIDQMFSQTEQVLQRYLGADQIDGLANQLAAAKAER